MQTTPKGQIVRVHVFISGEVQGVYFRDYTRRKAQSLSLTGWVRNLWDGRVEAVFLGHTTNFNQRVESLEIEHQQIQAVNPSAEVALKVIDKVRKGDAVYKVIE